MSERRLIRVARAAAVIVFAALALVVEGACGRLGLLFPAAVFAAFYLGGRFGWPVGGVTGLLVAVLAEVVWARPGSIVLLLAALVPAVVRWRRYGNRFAALPLSLLGLFAGLGYATVCLVQANVRLWPFELYLSPISLLWRTLGSAAAGALVFPLLAAVCDGIHRKCELEPDPTADQGHWIAP